MKRILTLSLIIICIVLPQISSGATITGLSVSCVSNCTTYSVQDGYGGPYIWITSGNIIGTNEGEEIELCWDIVGDNTVTVIDLSAPIVEQSTSINVQIINRPSPEIIFPKYPECIIQDSTITNPEQQEVVECKTVCSGSLVTYTAYNWQGNDIEWTIDGDGTIVETGDDYITVQWNETGSGKISLKESSFIFCSDEVVYCIEILPPFDIDILVLGGGIDSKTICKGQEVYFQAISDEATIFEWNFGNGNFSSGSQTSEVFDQSGNYIISLIGSTECKCNDTTYYNIIVEDEPGPEITCTGTTCASSEQTYYSNDVCTSYAWSVSGNYSISDGGGPTDDYITINWGSGPVGSVTLATTGCGTTLCAEPTTVQIPIIDGSVIIDGPTIACKDGYDVYSVPYYDGVEYNWSLFGNGSIISGFGTNEISIDWSDGYFSSDEAHIEVSYDNCYLECGGNASLDVIFLPRFDITANQEYCENSVAYLNSGYEYNAAPVDWVITFPNGSTDTYVNTSNLILNPLDVGDYSVVAADNAGLYCNRELRFEFTVISEPDVPNVINGPSEICRGEFYNYSIDLTDPTLEVRWTIRDGSDYFYPKGNPVSTQWNSNGPYEITAYVRNLDVYCAADPVTMFVNSIDNVNITTDVIACLDKIETYFADIDISSDGEWSLLDPTSGSLDIKDVSQVNVHWHKSGIHTLLLEYCGGEQRYNVNVSSKPVLDIEYDSLICPGDLANVNLNLSAGETLEILDESNTLVTTNPSSTLSLGKYTVEVKSTKGCISNYPIIIDTFPTPTVRISSPELNYFCLPHSGILIQALDTDVGYTYEWYKDGALFGSTANGITTNQFGTYYVIITDYNGCMIKSNEFTIYDLCNPGGGGPPSPGGGVISFTETSLSCNELTFNITSTAHSSTSFTWYFNYPLSGPDWTSTDESPTFEYSEAGYYYVWVVGNIPDELGFKIITIPAVADFDVLEACANNETTFHDISTFIPGYDITGYEWNFGDPGSGALNTSSAQNPVHVFDVPGFYLIELEISASVNGTIICTSTKTKVVEIEPGPISDFVRPFSSCTDEGLSFSALDDPDNFSYSWDFGDPASGEANISSNIRAIHTFSSSGSYDVSLTVMNFDGCENTTIKTINVVNSTLSGDITMDQTMPMCLGQSVTMTAPGGGAQYFWSSGELDQSIVTSSPGVYSVTIVDPSGCSYSPPPVNVLIEGDLNIRIRGSIEIDDFNSISYYDSVEVCFGQNVTLIVPYVSSVSYAWSSGGNSYYEQPGILPSGRHVFTVETTDPNTGCIISSKPFIINVIGLPESPIVTSIGSLCAQEDNLLTINNPDPNLSYYWSNGAVGITTNVTTTGIHEVVAVNKHGCEAKSNGIYISPRPIANLNKGCLMACFPDTICLPLIPGASSYTWLLDGSPLLGSSSDLIIDQPGDYQLIVESFSGCADTSDVMSIEAEPSDQSLEGTVFLDENGNGIFDAGDLILDGILVYLMSGTTVVDSVLSNGNGYYLFDPVTISNPMVTINIGNLDYNYYNNDSIFQVIFDNCIDDEEQDFPLIQNCISIANVVDTMICFESSIIIGGQVMYPGFSYDILESTTQGCDSLVTVNVDEFDAVTATFDVDASCGGESNGVVVINATWVTSGDAFISFDGGPFSSNLVYTDLATGVYPIAITTIHGCEFFFDVSVGEIFVPIVDSETQRACVGDDNGILTILPDGITGYQYSIDGTNFSLDTIFDDLPAGDGTFFVEYGNNCIKEFPYTITTTPIPSFALNTTDACDGLNNGEVVITPLSTGIFEYSLDYINWTTDLEFSGLDIGFHILFILDIAGCEHTNAFEIQEASPPIYEHFITNTCESEEAGSIRVDMLTTGDFNYSLDGINYSQDPLFENLSAGNYNVYIKNDQGCIHEFPAAIDIEPVGTVSWRSEDACPGESNGTIFLTNGNSTNQYSVDSINFYPDSIITGLASGLHTIFILEESGCIHPVEVEIIESEVMEVVFEDPEIDCSMLDLTLEPEIINAVGDVTYMWSDGSTTRALEVFEDGKYSLEVSDKCSSESYEWDIEFEFVEQNQPIFFPNIFSPNQDGINDCFKPVIDPEVIILDYRVLVFDRWGNKLFEGDDIEDCWDGFYKKRPVELGVFVYLVEFDFTYCEEAQHIKEYGDITVIR